MNINHCPHCGSVPFLQPHGMPGLENWQVICTSCQTAGPVMPTQVLAVFCWNGLKCGIGTNVGCQVAKDEE